MGRDARADGPFSYFADQQVRDGVGVDDDVFRAQVVIKEEKVLGRKPQNKSAKKGQKKVS